MHRPLRDIQKTLADAIRNTPIESLLAVLLAAAFSAGIADGIEGETLARVMMSGVLALAVVFAVSASHALKVFDGKTRWAMTGTALAATAAYGAWVLDVNQLTEIWRWSFLGIAAAMGVLLVPVAARMGEVSASERFWRYSLRLLSRVSVAYTYAVAMYLGLSIAVAAVQGLFDLSLGDHIFGHMFAWVVIGLGTVLAAGSLTEVKRIGEPFPQATLVWNGRLGTFLFMPLVILYLGIMYAYMARVFVTGEVPSNILSPLALGAGLLGYFGLFLLQPQMHRGDFKPLARLMRAFPAAFVPVVPLGIWAVWQRVEQYGWTEFRYARMAALVCLLVFSAIGAYRWLRRQEFSLVTGPAILGAAALIAAVGPFSATELSLRSQQTRLHEALQGAGLLAANGRMVPSSEMPPDGEVEETVYEATRYLLETHGDEALADLTSTDLGVHETLHEKLAALGVTTPSEPPNVASFTAPQPRVFALPRGGTIAEFYAYPGDGWREGGMKVVVSGSELRLTLPQGEARAHIAVANPFERTRHGVVTLESSEIYHDLVDEQGTVIGRVILRDGAWERTDGVGMRLTYASGLVHLY